MSSKLSLLSAQNDMLYTWLTYLDARSLAKLTSTNKQLKSAPTDTVFSVALVAAKQIDVLRRNRDMYALLLCDLPPALTANTKNRLNRFRIDACRIVEQIFKECMREAAALYIKIDSRTFTVGMESTVIEYKAIKLNGRDLREPTEREQHVLKPLKELNGSRTFKITSFAAQTLGTIICEDESINALAIQSAPDPFAFFSTHNRRLNATDIANFASESFNDQSAVTLLRALPAGRLRLFCLGGGFGHQTMQEYIKQMPRLYDSAPKMDPRDTLVLPLGRLADNQQQSDMELDKYTAQTLDYFTAKAQKQPGSVVNDPSKCAIM